MADPESGRALYRKRTNPAKGLAVARMAAHITHLSEDALHRKFGRGLQNQAAITYGFNADFQVESYLRYQGITFVDRFDANRYLYITRAMDIRSRRGLRRRARPAFKPHPGAVLPRVVPERLAVPHAEPGHRPGVERGGRQRRLRGDRTRQGSRRIPVPRTGLFDTVRGFIEAARRSRVGFHAGGRNRTCDGGTDMSPSQPPPQPRAPRVDLLQVADWCRARGCSMSAAGRRAAEAPGTKNQVDGRGVELSQSGVNFCVAKGLSVIQGDADRDLSTIPTKPSIMRS